MDIKRISVDNQINFGVRVRGNRQIKALYREIKDSAGPFIEKNKPLFTSIQTLGEFIAKAMNKIRSSKLVPECNWAQFKEVKRLRLGELCENREEYFYLQDKSQQYFSNQEAREYAEEIAPLFAVPEKLKPAYSAYLKLSNDIENGLKGALPLRLDEKWKNLRDGSNKLAFTTSDYTSVEYYLDDIKQNIKQLKERKDILNYFRYASKKMNGHINHFNKDLPLIRAHYKEAYKTYTENMLTPEEMKVLEKNHSQQIISRCVSRFNNHHAVRNTQLTQADNAEIDEILAKQKQAIENLWNKIETSKKEYFNNL